MPIGTPLDNTTVHVLDEKLRPVPPGVPGELYVSGAGLTRGYLGRPSLTGERFVACPFGPPGGRMYRTGDLVKWVENSRLIFLGRSDHQVKLRGYRMELAEIENALTRHPLVGRAVAVVRKGAAADGTLVGYVTAGGNGTPEGAGVLESVRASLPAYMVPSTVVVLDRMPLTPNGKVDRQALPAPSTSTGAEPRAPHGATEQAVCELFAEILGTDGVHVEQDFFAAGGSSLLVMRLVSRIRRTLRCEIGIRDLFEAPTPAALAARLSEVGEGSNARPPLRAAGDETPLIAPSQRGLWFLQQLEGFRSAYNVPYAARLSGTVEEDALRQALRDVAVRHDSLRTLYPADGGEPSPVVVSPDLLPELLSVVPADVSGLPALLQAESNLGFDLREELPWRAVLLRCDGGEDVLALVFHHLAFDGWSLIPFWRDLTDAYDHRVAGRAPVWEPLPFRYADYAAWQHRLLGPEDRPTELTRRQLDFWERTLAGLPEELSLPLDHTRPHGVQLTAESVRLHWTEETLARLNALARRENTSLLIVVQAAVSCFLGRVSGGTDVPLGTPVAGRTDEALDDMVGYFVNTVVVRADLSGAPSFGELVRRIRGTALAAFEHQDVPFDRVVELVGPHRDLGRNPLFQTMVTCARAPEHRHGFGGMTATPEEVRLKSAKFDLSFDFLEEAGGAGLGCRMLYCAELFAPETAEGLADEFHRLVLELCAYPELPLAEIRSRNTTVDKARPQRDDLPSLPEVLRERIAASPDDIALVHAGARLTYAELGRRVDRLAGLLTEYGVGPERKVGVLVPRSDLQIVALLAVLAAGGVFLPLDPSHPTARNEGILRSAEAVVVIDTVDHPLPETALPQMPRLTLDAPRTLTELQRAPDRTRSPVVYPAPEQAAYVIHTSGSTGRPKGVVVEHRHLASFFAAMVEQVFDPGTRHLARRRLSVSLTAALTFDASWQGLAALAAGHELHVVPEEVRRDPDAYTGHLLEHGVDLVDTTPTFAESLIASGLLQAENGPGILLMGGEPVNRRLWDTLRSRGGVRTYNVYGPTETTVNATSCSVEERSVPRVGAALGDTSVYVLDSDLRPVAPFVRGEIYLAGSQVARGYAGQPALTAERFVADPHGPPGSRMYRTGDLGCWDTSGHLAFSGRSDEQVKLRGVRIEPGEIATVVSEHPDVEHTVVLLQDSATGTPHLVAYVSAAEKNFSPERLRGYASERLPSYLVPAEYVRIDGVPLTSSGKLDRGALPVPRHNRPPEVRAAQTPQEEALCRLFAEVLETDRVGPEDDFFMLGGHSLLAVRLTNRIREEQGLVFGLEDLMQARTVAGLLGLSRGKSGEDPFAVVVPLREGSGVPLFCVHPVTGLAWSYSGLARRLPTGVPVHGLQAAGLHPDSAEPRSLEEMAETYLEHVRGVQPRGPYQLLGWSFGGNVAHAMATRLQELGESVSLLALVDSYPLNKIAPLTRDPGEASELTEMHLSTEFLRQMEPDRVRRIESVVRNNLELGDHFHPGVFRGNVLAFTANEEGRPSWIDPSMWEPHVDGVIDVRELPSAHFDLMGTDPRARIARALTPLLRQATE
ncbi:amino acid adenylation domain-containing protein [Nocardiopsis xinjiangensis]|uniref:amino acid adenylation domain-containing protein n=1 Tax=Nocardiopsis xinjiangensis TaxID=124285 RepID=UPI00034C01D5|nr:non-ribosomal peptide synthetase [Nocardiopsis xinjiangensis]